jgi:phage gp46-like protein
MTYCSTPLDSPAFQPVNGDCGELIKHDLAIEGGDLSTKDRVALSAILIQLNTDSRYAGERGWWGDQFNRAPLGSGLWRIGSKGFLDANPQAKVDEMIRTALGPLISQGVLDEIKVRTVRTIEGVTATVDALKGGASLFKSQFGV